eukprot:2219781-Prymnesium_polylepis.2
MPFGSAPSRRRPFVLGCPCDGEGISMTRIAAPANTSANMSAEIVVAHCSAPLGWLRNFTMAIEAAGCMHVVRTTIYSKCGRPVLDAPNAAEVR